MLLITVLALSIAWTSAILNCPSYAVEHRKSCVVLNKFSYYTGGKHHWDVATAWCEDMDANLLHVQDNDEIDDVVNKLIEKLSQKYASSAKDIRDYTIFMGKIAGRDDDCHVIKNDKNDRSHWIASGNICGQTRQKHTKSGFFCQFPIGHFEEFQNQPDCGLPNKDIVLEPIPFWPKAIESKTRRHKRIVFGEPTNSTYFPFWVNIFNYGIGSLIHPQFVLTADHVGRRHNSADVTQKLAGKFRKLLGGCRTDVKIMHLAQPKKIEKGVLETVCLPEYSSNIMEDDHYCFVAGTGNQFGTARLGYKKWLQQLQVEILKDRNQKYESEMLTMRAINRTIVDPNGSHVAGTAPGDSGTPVVCRRKNNMRWQVVSQICGITTGKSFGINLAAYKPWLDYNIHKLKMKGFPTM